MALPFHQSVVCPVLVGRGAPMAALERLLSVPARGMA